MAEGVNISVSDPVSADIQAVCGAITALCNFLCSEQGQALCKLSITNTVAFNSKVEKAAAWFVGLFKRG